MPGMPNAHSRIFYQQCYCLTKIENIGAYLSQQYQRGREASDDTRTNRGNRERRCSSACPPQKSLL